MQSDIVGTNSKFPSLTSMEAISEKLAVTRELYTPVAKDAETTS